MFFCLKLMFYLANQIKNCWTIPKRRKQNIFRNILGISLFCGASPLLARRIDADFNINKTNDLYSCFRCNRVYRRLKTLTRHLRHECGKGKHICCTICGHTTQRSDRLITHIRSQHPELADNLPTRRRKLYHTSTYW